MDKATPVALVVLQAITGSTVEELPWTQVLGALTENELMAGGFDGAVVPLPPPVVDLSLIHI